MRTIIQTIVAVLALTVLAPGYAEEVQQNFFTKVEAAQAQSTVDKIVTGTRDKIDSLVHFVTTPWIDFTVSSKDEDCLARNIFYEAGSESEEGKAAVAIVTINRVKDGRFDKSICGVVNQRTVSVRSQQVKKTEMIQSGFFGQPREIVKTEVVLQHVPVCQFSWVCLDKTDPSKSNPKYKRALQVAYDVMVFDMYKNVVPKSALFFHSIHIDPLWPYKQVAIIGNHIFYSKQKVKNEQKPNKT